MYIRAERGSGPGPPATHLSTLKCTSRTRVPLSGCHCKRRGLVKSRREPRQRRRPLRPRRPLRHPSRHRLSAVCLPRSCDQRWSRRAVAEHPKFHSIRVPTGTHPRTVFEPGSSRPLGAGDTVDLICSFCIKLLANSRCQCKRAKSPVGGH